MPQRVHQDGKPPPNHLPVLRLAHGIEKSKALRHLRRRCLDFAQHLVFTRVHCRPSLQPPPLLRHCAAIHRRCWLQPRLPQCPRVVPRGAAPKPCLLTCCLHAPAPLAVHALVMVQVVAARPGRPRRRHPRLRLHRPRAQRLVGLPRLELALRPRPVQLQRQRVRRAQLRPEPVHRGAKRQVGGHRARGARLAVAQPAHGADQGVKVGRQARRGGCAAVPGRVHRPLATVHVDEALGAHLDGEVAQHACVRLAEGRWPAVRVILGARLLLPRVGPVAVEVHPGARLAPAQLAALQQHPPVRVLYGQHIQLQP
mmetsp:Transcript_12367/g.30346  ORF Transcript_12367/g.30346 Transcript_12367/m.30346 type:complete len:312 (-) Transcript_12367:511-1446(-)